MSFPSPITVSPLGATASPRIDMSPPGTPDDESGLASSGIPKLEDFDISPKTGFLPEPGNLIHRLNDEYYRPWESIVDNLSSFLLTRRVRPYVREMPVLDTRRLQNVAEYRRAFVCLSFIAHAYVWGHNEEPCDVLPASVSIPWTTVSRRLRLHPVCSYPAVVLWNYRPLISSNPLDLSNLASIQLFTGCMDEAWFYLVSCAIESAGAPGLPAIIEAMHAASRDDIPTVTRSLRILEKVIKDVTEVLLHMYDGCDPHIFYFRVRKFLAAWAGNPLLPEGLLYQGVNDVDIPEYEIDGSVEKDLEGFSKEFRLPREDLDWSSAGACKWEDEDMSGSWSAAERAESGPLAMPKSTGPTEDDWTLSGLHQRVPPEPASRSGPKPAAPSWLGGVRRKFAGGSAAQSPIIQALDIALGVEHRPQFAHASRKGSGVLSESGTGAGVSHASLSGDTASPIPMTREPSSLTTSSDSHRSPHSFESGTPKNFIHEMRAYLPGPHRSFLLALSRAPSIRAYVSRTKKERPEDQAVAEMATAFNGCVDGMKKFRDRHVQMVSVYVLIQGKKRRAEEGVVEAGGVGVGGVAGESKGTGGTNILPFLRQSREETKAAQV